MKIYKSRFWYTKSQRNGVLFLIVLIFIVQILYFFVDFSSNESILVNSAELLSFEKQLDSLKKEKENKPKLYPFNPNYITDYKGYVLGMSITEIDRLHRFRKQNKFVNSVNDFKKITKVSDSLLKKIAPYFKFPDWVVKKKKKTKWVSSKKVNYYNKKTISTNDINKATAEDFASIKGIGEKSSTRIVKYRRRLQGFTYTDQLFEVWNIEPELIKQLLDVFVLIEKPSIVKINVNTASFNEVLKTPYVDYELCKKIFNYRDEVAELQNILELKNIEGFPIKKYERIVLYLDTE